MKTLVIRTLSLAALSAALIAPARAALPEEGWWRVGAATVGLHVQGPAFCGISATQDGVWVLRGRVIDGRLVEDDRSLLRGVRQQPDAAEPVDPTDYFVQPTSLVRRDRTSERPRGMFAHFEPLPAAPDSTLWLDMVWGCSREAEVEKLAASGAERP